MEILQVAQHADDLDRASDFYEALLGQPPIRRFDQPPRVFFNIGITRLLLQQEAPSSLFYLQVDDVRSSVQELRQRGVEIVAEPSVEFRYGLDHDADLFGPADADEWVALIRDSEGNTVGLLSHEARHEP